MVHKIRIKIYGPPLNAVAPTIRFTRLKPLEGAVRGLYLIHGRVSAHIPRPTSKTNYENCGVLEATLLAGYLVGGGGLDSSRDL